MEPARCRVCDHRVELADRFCARCGHDLSAGFVPLVGEEPAVAVEASGGRPRRVVVGVAAVLVTLAAVFGVVAWLTGSDDSVPGEASPTTEPSRDDDRAASGGASGAAQPRRTPRTGASPGPTPEAPMLGDESGLMVAVRAEDGIVVVDLDSGERFVIDEAALIREDPTVLSTMALFGLELWVVTDDGLRAFDLRDRIAEIVPGSGNGTVDAPFVDDVEGFVVPAPSAGFGVVVALTDGSFLLDPGRGVAPTPFLAPVGFEVLGSHRVGAVLTRPEIGGAWLLADTGPRRITAALPLALSAAGLLVFDCDEDLTCSFAVVDVETGETIRLARADARPTLPEPGTVSLLAPDGSSWVLAGQGTTGKALDFDTGGQIPGLVTGIVTAAAFSPDSRWLFLAGDAADRPLLTAVTVDLSLPRRTIATDVDLGAATEVLVFERPDVP
jgi:hypothetical protein